MMIADYLGLVEFGLYAAAVLAISVWQYWTVRDAGRGVQSAEDTGVPKRDHEADDR